MSEERPSGEEIRRKMKEEFKQDLRARKEFLEKVKRLRQTQRINEALSNMSVDDDTDDWINKLNEETAFMDAKTELALEGKKVINVPIEGADGSVTTVPDPLAEEEIDLGPSEEELRKIAAEELVRQMKAEIAAEHDSPVAPPKTAPPARPRVDASAPVSSPPAAHELPQEEGRPFRKMMDDIQQNPPD
jgi:uncharacterized membrane protein